MTKTVLLAARPEFRETLGIWIQTNHKLITFGALAEAIVHLDETRFQIAIIDEDFDGADSGWLLAKKIREKRIPCVKIVILGSRAPQDYYQSEQYKGRFDWVMSLPISYEQLLSELDRKWPISD